MRIKFFLADNEELLPNVKLKIVRTEYLAKESINLIELCGELGDIIIKRGVSMYAIPDKTIITNGVTYVTTWRESLL